MFLSKLLKRPYTIVFRLTAWYAGVYVVISLAIFILLYFMVRSYIYQRVDNYFQAEVEEYRVIYRSMGMDEVKADITGEETAIGEDKKFFRILSPAGRELAASDLSAWKNLKTEKTILNRVKTPTALFETIVRSEEHTSELQSH